MISGAGVAWIAANILPHEADVRRWLKQHRFPSAERDDTIQEAYCRIAGIADFSVIRSGRAYFFTTVKNILFERIRHERIVRIEAMAELERLCRSSEPSAERVQTAREQLALVQSLIDCLPERCRQVFTLSKIDDLSQRQIATRLGLTENVVEKEIAAGMRRIMRRLAEDETRVPPKRERQPLDATRNQRRG